MLLDHLILEIYEKEEATGVEKELQSDKEKKLVAAGENIRERELKGKKDDDDVEEDVSSACRYAKKTRARRNEVVHSDDELAAALLSQ